jgi:outer membrane protein insertion porin family
MNGAGRHITTVIVLALGLWLSATSVSPQDAPRDMKKFGVWLAKRPLISKISIEGNSFFSEREIRSRLFSRKNSFLQSLKSGSRNRVLRYSVIRDTMEVKYLYLRQGFLNISIDESISIASDDPDSSAIITLTINEGGRFVVSSVALDAPDSLPFYSGLVKTASRLRAGDPVDPFKLKEIVFDLKAIFANNGYPYAQVTEIIDSSLGSARAAISFRATSGRLVRFGGILVKNLTYYSPYLARREVVFKQGELYSREKIIESQRRLYSTNLFNSVNLEIDRSRADSSGATDTLVNPDFIFSAVERKPHFVSVQTGASQDSLQDLTWDFTTSWGKRNIFVSRRIELSFKLRYIIFTQWRTLYHRYEVKYTEPWFFNIRMPLTLTARFEPAETWSLALSTRKEWSERLFAVITGRYENVTIFGIPPENQTRFRAEQGIRVRRMVDLTVVRDTRIDKFIPKSGSFTTYFAQFVGGPLGGDDSFLKLEFSWARYQMVFGNAVYATRFKTGWVKEFGQSSEVPSNDRFYLGGANSLRGFRENSIGPRDSTGTNTGANAYALFNQELRVPLLWKFWGSVFTDLGNGWESFAEAKPENILFAYGAGLQFISPAGPIRLDYAHHLENGPYREDDRFHFTILYAF